MPIVPDTKDWTWVLERECPECGFDATRFPHDEVAELIRQNAVEWRQVFDAAEPDQLRQRPSDDRWSALEYACHVRDVHRLYDYRLGLMLGEDDPTFPDWNQDASAIDNRYSEQDPATVVAELAEAAAVLATSFDDVLGVAWERTGTRSDGAHFTVETFARYMIHDPVHHIYDVRQGLARLR